MSEHKSFITRFGEMIDQYRLDRLTPAQGPPSEGRPSGLRWLGRQMMPNIGTLVLYTGTLSHVPIILSLVCYC